jgi:riboflavin kinase/FMN adenylyltransferase
MLVPADGVYAGYLRRLDAPLHVMPAAVSVGTNPTFDGSTRRVEAYVLDGDTIDGDTLDLYGVEVAISFVARLRGQQRFDDVPGLVAQMALDVARTREALEAVDASALSARWPT